MNCPICGADITETYEPDAYACEIVGGWYCDPCDLEIGEHEYPAVPVPIPKHCNAYAFTVWVWRRVGFEPIYWGA